MTRFLLHLFIGLVITSECIGQSSRESRRIFRQAEKRFERQDFLKAFHLYGRLIQSDSLNYQAYYKSGLCLFNISNTDTAALAYFIKAKKKVPEAYFYTGRIYHLRNECEKALEEFYYYKTINKGYVISNKGVDTWVKKCELFIKERSLKDNYTVRNLGSPINTPYPEYVPLIWKWNESLVFTSRRKDSKEGQMDPYGKFYEDIYVSAKAPDGTWKAAVGLSDSLNTGTHDACVAFSPEGDELIIYRTDEQKTGGDLYTTRFNGSTWSRPIKMGAEINSEYLEASACFSAYGNEIIFSSNRPGGYGGKDLYRVVRFMNGKYSLPKNLGPEINTEEDEDAPFLDRNDNTLYFSSRGHVTIGEYDIFKADYNAETYTWQNVQNFGQPLNSTHDDIYFVKDDNRNAGYFTSRREGGLGDADLYEVNFSESDLVIVYCKLNLPEQDGQAISNLQLTLHKAKTGELAGIWNPSQNYKSIILLAVENERYELRVEGQGIQPLVKSITFIQSNKELRLDLQSSQ
jgi:hypothetical protein